MKNKSCGTKDGFARRFECRPEFRMWGGVLGDVVDATNIRTRTTTDNLTIFRLSDVFTGQNEVLIGFGRPNTYLVVPDGNDEAGYEKFAGKSLKLAPSKVEETRGWVQAGIQMRILGLPEHAAAALRASMRVFHGAKYWTCVNACMKVLEHAGFTSPAGKLSNFYMPHALLPALIDHGLYFQGQEVKLQFIRTSDLELHGYSKEIIKAELTTLCRHAEKKMPALAAARSKLTGVKKVSRVITPVAPALPDSVEYASDFEVRVSRASITGAVLRMVWGAAHGLFTASQNRVQVTDYLIQPMKPFPVVKDVATRVKKWLLFTPLTIWLIRLILVPRWKSVGMRSECDIYNMLRTHSDKKNHKYNLVVTSRQIIIARISIGTKLLDWILSKHVLMSGYDKFVLFAGEIWKDEHGVIHVNRNSGTYKPTEEQLDAIVAFLQAIFPHLTIVKAGLEE